MINEDRWSILVTGGAGFVGSHLVDRLLTLNPLIIIVIDDLSTGRKENLAQCLDDITFIEGDICDESIIETIINSLQGLQLTHIFHLACTASPLEYQKRSISTLKTSFVGTLNMLEVGRRHNAIFIYSSSSEVYGDPTEHPQTETYRGNVNCLGPRACYDEGKRIGETLCMEYVRQFKCKIRIARIFNTFGPRMRIYDGRVICSFFTQALANQSITIYGDGQYTRSFMYIDDLIDALLLLAMTTLSSTSSSFQANHEGNDDDEFHGPVNLGNPNEEYTIQEVAEMIKKLTNNSQPIIYVPPLPDDPMRRKPDITVAKRALNWEPKLSFHEGLLRMIDYFRNM